MINWKVRIKNKTFWVTIIPAILLLIEQVLNIFGVTINTTDLAKQLIEVVNTVFVILSISGIVIDHTTNGINDSYNAMQYKEPKEF